MKFRSAGVNTRKPLCSNESVIEPLKSDWVGYRLFFGCGEGLREIQKGSNVGCNYQRVISILLLKLSVELLHDERVRKILRPISGWRRFVPVRDLLEL